MTMDQAFKKAAVRNLVRVADRDDAELNVNALVNDMKEGTKTATGVKNLIELYTDSTPGEDALHPLAIY